MTPTKPWLSLFIAVGAIWGASFLFMRLAGSEFAPVVTSCLRMAIGALTLLPLLWWRGLLPQLRANWRLILGISLINAAIPFTCFAFAVMHITTGLSAILNATVPMFAALVSWLWLGQRLNVWRLAGILLGFVGVAMLTGDQASVKGDTLWLSIAAVGACLLATLCYGVSGNMIKEKLSHLHPWTIAGGTMLGATLWLAVPALFMRPAAMPGWQAWSALLAVGVLCSAVAFMLYFELLQRTDATKTMSVTYLIPVFALVYGALFLNERSTLWMVCCGLVVLLGTALATGLIHAGSIQQLLKKKPTKA